MVPSRTIHGLVGATITPVVGSRTEHQRMDLEDPSIDEVGGIESPVPLRRKGFSIRMRLMSGLLPIPRTEDVAQT
jgi:hypothetical protein